MFIQTEATPNPATLKFLPGKVVLNEGTVDFREEDEAEGKSPLASKLFAIPSVNGVFSAMISSPSPRLTDRNGSI